MQLDDDGTPEIQPWDVPFDTTRFIDRFSNEDDVLSLPTRFKRRIFRNEKLSLWTSGCMKISKLYAI